VSPAEHENEEEHDGQGATRFRLRDRDRLRHSLEGTRQRRFQSGLRTKTEAREWFDATVKPRIRAGAPDPSITFDTFAALYIERHGATVSKRTRETIEERLAPSRARFGTWTLRELEGAATEIAAWRACLSASSRNWLTAALRQSLGAAVRWRYLSINPAVEAGPRVVRRARRGRGRAARPYHLRHTFATEALAAGVSIFELARVMGTSVKMIDRTYGHLAQDSEEAILARLEARADRIGVGRRRRVALERENRPVAGGS